VCEPTSTTRVTSAHCSKPRLMRENMEGVAVTGGLVGLMGRGLMAVSCRGGGMARVVGMPGSWDTADEIEGLTPCCSAISATLHSCTETQRKTIY
jgi:hypothetical protein